MARKLTASSRVSANTMKTSMKKPESIAEDAPLTPGLATKTSGWSIASSPAFTCSLPVIGADGQPLHFSVRNLRTVLKTAEGARLSLNLCGAAVPELCRTALSSPTGSPAIVSEADGECRGFGSVPEGPMPPQPVMSLLSPQAPERGIVMHYADGALCTDDVDAAEAGGGGSSSGSRGERRASVTFILRCDPDERDPVVKSLHIKGRCDLEIELVAVDGCPNPPWLSDADGMRGIGDKGKGVGEVEGVGGAESANGGTGLCLGGTSKCTIAMLLDPQCDPACASDACYWDNGACFRMTMGCPGCLPEWLHDGECDDECFTQECEWDSGDCVTSDGRFVTPSQPRCLPSCPASWQGDGECDPACDTRACNYDDGDCAPGSCLLALAAPDRSAPSSPGASVLDVETAMGEGMGHDGGGTEAARAATFAAAVSGAGPPSLAQAATVWYDLSGFGVQRLAIPAERISLDEGTKDGGTLVGQVELVLALCEPLHIGMVAHHVPSCVNADAAQATFDARLRAAHANASALLSAAGLVSPARTEGHLHGRSLSEADIMAEMMRAVAIDDGEGDGDGGKGGDGGTGSKIGAGGTGGKGGNGGDAEVLGASNKAFAEAVLDNGSVGLLATERAGECLLASLGFRPTLTKTLLDTSRPREGLELSFSTGTPCAGGEGGTHSVRFELLCAPGVVEAQRVGYERIGCEWTFTMRFAGACAMAQPPGAASGGVGSGDDPMASLSTTCSPGCMAEWLSDGVCDRLCNVTRCEYDHGDCLSHSAAVALASAHGGADDEALSAVEEWLCGVSANLKAYRHGHGGGSTSGGDCELTRGSLADGLAHAVTPTLLVSLVVSASLGGLCLIGLVVCMCVRYRRALAEGEDMQRALAKYREARGADAEEVGGMLAEDDEK